MELQTSIPFFFALIALGLSPGPGALAAMSLGFNQGCGPGKITAAGLLRGLWTPVAVVVAGRRALLAASAPARFRQA